ncbi:MAG: DUF4082 domain-containing protein [Acidobacteriales bacterium]|nr:DUF4082 domain-containing protein [Terriglobales bacterium]
MPACLVSAATRKDFTFAVARHFALAFLLLASIVFHAQVSVTTQHYDNNRTGANLNESTLNTGNVVPGTFGKLFTRAVDGHIYAQPLYVPNVSIPKLGVHNVIYVATEHNSVYAFDADYPGVSDPLWQVNLGTPRPAGFPTKYGIESGIQVEIGITSTPVIDTSSGTIYVVAYTQDSSTGPYHYKLHALDISSGAEKFGGPVEVQASVPGNGDGSVNGIVTFDPKMHMQRPSLLLSNGTVYFGFGAFADTDPYHGWIMGYNATTLAQVAVFNTSPDAGEGAVWMSGQGLLADSSGNLYFMVGNGSTTAETGGSSYGNGFLKLAGSNLSLLDWFLPYNATSLADADLDVGSSGPVLIPGTTLLAGAGKEGILYLIDTTHMGHWQASGDMQIVQSFPIASDEIFNTPIFWNSLTTPTMYVWPDDEGLKAYSFAGGMFGTNPVSQNNTLAPAQPGGTLALSANGSKPGSAIVWATHSTAGSAETVAQPGELHAFDATNLATELWNSLQNPARDDSGRYGKFNPPTVANGKVYLGTFSEQLDVYGLLPLPLAAGQTIFTTQTPAIQNQNDGVSYEQGVKFTASKAGAITGIRYWKAPSETGAHTGHIWSTDGNELTGVTFANETASGWQQAVLGSPLTITAGTTFVVSVNTNSVYAQSKKVLTKATVNGDLATVADGKNGVFGTIGTYPTSPTSGTNFFRDVVFQPSATQSVFTTQTPASSNINEQTSYELGMRFSSDQAGEIAAIRFWKDANESGTHVGHIWASNGGELANITFTGESASGWQVAYLTTPVSIAPNTIYTVSVNINVSYVSTVGGLANLITNGPLTTVADGNNGVFGTIGTFPTSSSQSQNYFRDVLFIPTGKCQRPQAPTGVVPSPGVSLVNLAWSATPGATSFTVKRSTTSGSGYRVIATGLGTSTYTDNTGLRNGTTYYYVVTAANSCGQSSNSDEVSATPERSFNGTSLFTTQTPAAAYTDGPWELGMKFQTSRAGKVISIRYYKVAGESGVHTGNLWDASGNLLGTAVFGAETASGWQTANLANPVSLAANTTYIVSVNSNLMYGATNQELATTISNPPLSSVADGDNGVYTVPGAFPTLTYQNSNYYRDVVFQ